jgi:putative membrane protein
MATDLTLTIIHHVLAFTILGTLAAEFGFMWGPIDGNVVRRLSMVDAIYGAAAGAIILVGTGRVYFGLKTPDAYTGNAFFWAKMTAFAVVGILSIRPSVLFIGWRKRFRTDSTFIPEAGEIRTVRRLIVAELIVFPLIPSFAATMARGFNL